MKPKTILQKQVVSLSAKLPKITQTHKNWAIKNLFSYRAARLKTRIYCLECSHTWKDDSQSWHNEITGVSCPSCHKDLKMYSHNGDCKSSVYHTKITTIDDYQVIRLYITYKTTKKRQYPTYETFEVVRHFINSKGKKVTLSNTSQMYSGYYDNWNHSSGLEVRSPSNNEQYRNNLIGDIYPKQKILPIIKRNGYTGQLHDLAMVELFSLLIKSNKAETLLKAKQFDLLRSYLHNQRDVDYWWSSIKVCLKNDYTVQNAASWFDYLRQLVAFNRDIKSPKYVCPVDFSKEHQRYTDKQRKLRDAENLETKKLQMAADEKLYRFKKQKFGKLVFEQDDLKISFLINVKEVLNEALELHHCVYMSNYHKKESSILFSAKVNGIRTETIEFSITTFKILQSRGNRNRASIHHDKILELFNKNIPLIQQSLKKKSKKEKTPQLCQTA
jgi:hypothetical protein